VRSLEVELTEKIDGSSQPCNEAGGSNSDYTKIKITCLRSSSRPVDLGDTHAIVQSALFQDSGNAVAYTTMKTAVNIEAKPIQVKIASLPSVWMLANTAVQIAAIMVQATMHTLPLARILSP
jgi:hypothetical protein